MSLLLFGLGRPGAGWLGLWRRGGRGGRRFRSGLGGLLEGGWLGCPILGFGWFVIIYLTTSYKTDHNRLWMTQSATKKISTGSWPLLRRRLFLSQMRRRKSSLKS